MSNSGSALISSVQFPVLRVTDNFSATDVLTWISETVQLINAYPTLHRSSRILQQGVHKDARRALTIMLTRPGKTPPDWDYPADLELNVGFDVDKLDKVKSFELKWLELLRQQVATDTTETILEGLAAVALPRLVLTTAIVLIVVHRQGLAVHRERRPCCSLCHCFQAGLFCTHALLVAGSSPFARELGQSDHRHLGRNPQPTGRVRRSG